MNTCEMISIDILAPCAIVGGIGILAFLLGRAVRMTMKKMKRKI